MKYELEKARHYGWMGDKHEETPLAKSDDLRELIELGKKVKLTGNQHYWEEARIIEYDEYGDIIDYVWESEPKGKRLGGREGK